jgi:hypothetical protein
VYILVPDYNDVDAHNSKKLLLTILTHLSF